MAHKGDVMNKTKEDAVDRIMTCRMGSVGMNPSLEYMEHLIIQIERWLHHLREIHISLMEEKDSKNQ